MSEPRPVAYTVGDGLGNEIRVGRHPNGPVMTLQTTVAGHEATFPLTYDAVGIIRDIVGDYLQNAGTVSIAHPHPTAPEESDDDA